MKRRKIEMSSKLKERLQKRYEDRGKSSNREQALNFGKNKVEFFKPKVGGNRISIVPYFIRTKNHPLVAKGDAKIGEDDFVLDLWIHRYVGPNNADIICPRKNYRKPCPICEQEKIYRDQGNKEEADSCRASHRAYYNVVDESEDSDKSVKIFSESYNNFQNELMNDAGEEGEIIDFPNAKHGKIIKFRAEEKKFKNSTYFEYRSFKFYDRDKLSEEVLRSAISLDECVVVHSYDEIRAIFYGEDSSDEKDDEDLDDDNNPSSQSKHKKNDEEDEDLDDSSDSKEDESLKKKDDDDDDDDDDGKKEEPTSKKKAMKCPSGFEFGKDCEQHDECDDCKVWADCFAYKKELKGKKK